jgi:NADPH:quinone reductase-like Zn-dependent oxidoreductase
MKAVVLYEYGDASKLRFETDKAVPSFGSNEVLVRVHATSINPIDWKVRSGSAKDWLPVHFPDILGRDVAGEVADRGHDVKGFEKGMRVMGLADGTYAEYTAVRADLLCPIPEKLSYEQAAALPLVLLTGAQLMERGVQIQSGQTVLVTGAVGGVGRTAVHVARKHGAHVIAGVREAQRAEAKKLGAERIVALDNDKEVESLRDLDAIADTVDGETIVRLLRAIKAGGVLGSVLGEPKEAAGKNFRVAAISAEPDAQRLYELATEVARGEFSIPIQQVLPLKDASKAHQIAESGHTHGKVILKAA